MAGIGPDGNVFAAGTGVVGSMPLFASKSCCWCCLTSPLSSASITRATECTVVPDLMSTPASKCAFRIIISRDGCYRCMLGEAGAEGAIVVPTVVLDVERSSRYPTVRLPKKDSSDCAHTMRMKPSDRAWLQISPQIVHVSHPRCSTCELTKLPLSNGVSQVFRYLVTKGGAQPTCDRREMTGTQGQQQTLQLFLLDGFTGPES